MRHYGCRACTCVFVCLFSYNTGKCRPLLFPKVQFVKIIWNKYNRMKVFCGVARVQAIAIANRHEDKGRCVQLEHAKKQEELERPL